MRNKKGFWFSPALSFITLVILIIALSVISSKQNNIQDNLGTKQYGLINAYNQGEKYLFYLDESARMSMIDSVYKMAEKGGYYGTSRCGTYKNYNLLSSSSKDIDECMPVVYESHQEYMKNSLYYYLSNYSKILEQDIPATGYFVQSTGGLESYGYSVDRMVLGKSFKRFGKTPTQKGVNKFHSYEITWYGKVNMEETWEVWGDVRDAEATERFYTDGTKLIYADLKYTSSGDLNSESHNSWTKTNTKIRMDQIENDKGKYGYPEKFKEITKVKLSTFDDNGIETCSIELNYKDDLPTWEKGQDRNADGITDEDCEDSPSWLECPGIRLYYCGYYARDTFPRRNIPNWQTVPREPGIKNLDDIRTHYVLVDEYDNNGLAIQQLHTKTSAKFAVDIDNRWKSTESSVIKDENLKQTRGGEVVGEEPSYWQYGFLPRFHQKINYNLTGAYEKLANTSKNFENNVRKCENTKTFDKCLEQELPKDWKIIKTSDDAIHNFTEAIKQCKELNRNIICKITLDAKNNYEVLFESYGKSTYLTSTNYKESTSFNIFLTDADGFLSNMPPGQIVNIITGKHDYYFLKYGDDIALIPDILTKTSLANTLGEITLINRNRAFKYTSDDIIPPYSKKINYTFALSFKNLLPPKPITNLEIKSAPRVDNSIMMIWDKTKESDLASFEVVYSENDLSTKDTDTIIKNEKLHSISLYDQINSNNPSFKVIDSLYLDDCKFFKYKENNIDVVKCLYGTDDSYTKVYELEVNQLYLLKSLQKYVYIYYDPISLETDKEYYLGIIGKDNAGNMIDNVNEKILIKKTKVLDQLPPGPVHYSVKQGSLLFEPFDPAVTDNLIPGYEFNINEIESYVIYWNKGIFTPNAETLGKDYTEFVKYQKTFSKNEEIRIPMSDLTDKPETLRFSLIAIDKFNNPDTTSTSIKPAFPFYPKFFSEVHEVVVDNTGTEIGFVSDSTLYTQMSPPNLLTFNDWCSGTCLMKNPNIESCHRVDEVCIEGNCYKGKCVKEFSDVLMAEVRFNPNINYHVDEVLTQYLNIKEIDPILIEQYIKNVYDYAKQFNINPFFVAALIDKESAWKTELIGYKFIWDTETEKYRYINKDGDYITDEQLPQEGIITAMGIMQVSPAVAQEESCRVNWGTSIEEGTECGTKHLNRLVGSVQDTTCIEIYSLVECTAAAYNGGVGSLYESDDCPGDVRWACEWDDPPETPGRKPNVGYKQTRDYVDYVNEKLEMFRNMLSEYDYESIESDYIWPVESIIISSCFGERNYQSSSFTYGTDVFSCAQTIVSMTDGTIATVNNNYDGDFGMSVCIESVGDNICYLHLDSIEPGLVEGVYIKQGQPIGITGSSGHGQRQYPSYGCHLDFRITRQGVSSNQGYIDPFDPQNNVFDYRNFRFLDDSNCFYNKDKYTYLQFVDASPVECSGRVCYTYG